MGIYPVALTSASLQSARYFGFFPRQFHAAHDRNQRLPAHTNQRGYGHFSHHEVSSQALPSCRGAARARHFASSVDAARVSEKHSRAQAFAHPSRAVRHPRLSPVCAHRASVARVARRGFRPVLPGVAIARANAESHDTGNIPGERARVSRASAVSRHASADWLTACVLSHFASHTPAEPDPELPAAPVFAVSVPSRFCATQQVAKKNRDSLAPSSERAAVAFVRSTVEVRASAPE